MKDEQEKLQYLVSIICIIAAGLVVAIYYLLFRGSFQQVTLDFIRDILSNAFVALVATPIVFFLLERKGIISTTKDASDLAKNIAKEVAKQTSDNSLNLNPIISFKASWKEFEWDELLKTAKEMEIVVSYWSAWVSQHMDAIVSIFDRNGSITVILPNPDNSEAIESTRKIFTEYTSEALRNEIILTAKYFSAAYNRSTSHKKHLEIRYFDGSLNYAAVRFNDDRLYFGFYEHFWEYQIRSFAILFNLKASKSLQQFWEKELENFYRVAKPIPIENFYPKVSD